MKKHIALLAALAALTAAAPAAPAAPATIQNADWGLHHDDPIAAPEASPALIVALAGAALIMRRNGGAR